jgi:hypothetical protein
MELKAEIAGVIWKCVSDSSIRTEIFFKMDKVFAEYEKYIEEKKQREDNNGLGSAM